MYTKFRHLIGDTVTLGDKVIKYNCSSKEHVSSIYL